MIALVIDKDLRLVVQPPEGAGMQDAVAIARIGRARVGGRLLDQPPPAGQRLDGKRRKGAALLVMVD